MEATPTANNLPDETKAVQTSLLQLPLELRRMIYWRSILVARRPTPEQVHQRNFGAIWEDIPSPRSPDRDVLHPLPPAGD